MPNAEYKKKLTSGHSANTEHNPFFIVFQNNDKTFEFQLIDIRWDKYVFIARPKANLTSKKKVTSGHSANIAHNPIFIDFPKNDKTFEFKLIDIRWDKYVFIARPKAYLTS